MDAEIGKFVEQVRMRSDIYSVVSSYNLPLKLKNGEYWTRCPFHDGDEESFAISPSKGFFYCFRCHVGGDAFKFISMKENISYFEAVKHQAKKLGIFLPLHKKDSATLELKRRKKFLFKINWIARNFYHRFLTKSDEGNAGRKYLAARGITGEAIEKFRLGFASKDPEELLKFFFKQNISSEQLLDSGIVFRQESDEKKIIDRMQGQLVIPVMDVFGRVAGIVGRNLESIDENDSARFFDIPKTIVFDESNFVFGLNKPVDSLILVRSFTDAIFFKSVGIENVAATSNVPFNEKQLHFLLKYAKKIVFCCEGEERRQKELSKILSIIKNFEDKIFFISVPKGDTLKNFLLKNGKEKFNDLVEHALTVFDYRLQCALSQNAHSSLGEKIETLKKIFHIIPVEKSAEISETHLKKISASLELDQNKILNEWQKLSSPRPYEKKVVEPLQTPKKLTLPKKKSKEDVWFSQACRKILRICWLEDDLLSFVTAMVPEESFSEAQREIVNYIKKSSNEERRPDISNAKSFLSEKAYIEISKILVNLHGYDPRDEDIREFDDSVRIIRKICLQRSLESKNQESKKYLNENDLISYEKIFSEIDKIKKELNSLK